MDAHSCLGEGHAEQSPDDKYTVYLHSLSFTERRQVGTDMALSLSNAAYIPNTSQLFIQFLS